MEAKGQRVPKLEAIASRFSGLRPDGEGEMATIRGGVRMDAKCLLLGLEQENVHHRSGCVVASNVLRPWDGEQSWDVMFPATMAKESWILR